jgi:hypothetical protein
MAATPKLLLRAARVPGRQRAGGAPGYVRGAVQFPPSTSLRVLSLCSKPPNPQGSLSQTSQDDDKILHCHHATAPGATADHRPAFKVTGDGEVGDQRRRPSILAFTAGRPHHAGESDHTRRSVPSVTMSYFYIGSPGSQFMDDRPEGDRESEQRASRKGRGSGAVFGRGGGEESWRHTESPSPNSCLQGSRPGL